MSAMTGAFVVDWMGRRPLFIASNIGMLVGMLSQWIILRRILFVFCSLLLVDSYHCSLLGLSKHCGRERCVENYMLWYSANASVTPATVPLIFVRRDLLLFCPGTDLFFILAILLLL